jgi:thiol-disulfide isomerase/thioredoxin
VDFTANYYIPVDFKTLSFSNQVTPPSVLGLEGKPAPDWLLKDIDGKEYSLKNIKGDILMIQFTGIGCGHCHASIPFLKNLVSEYQNKNFKFISIESISSNVSGIKRYAEMNQINYLYLISNKETSKDYQVDGLPVFFIINKDRIIKKVMLGYDNNGVREKEIREAINSLL